ncbi:ArsR family transcriptional regulator [Klebsiella quasipneumoniae]
MRPSPARKIIIDNVLAEGIFRQPKAVNMRSPHHHRAQ